MFKAMTSAAVALIVGVALSSPAAAQFFAPTSTDVYFQGYARIMEGEVSCDLSFTVSIDATGSATVLDPTFGGINPWCDYATAAYGTWTITPDFYWMNSATMTVGYSFLGDACSDSSIPASFMSGVGGAEIDIPPVLLLPVPPNYDHCTFEANVWTNQPIWITP